MSEKLKEVVEELEIKKIRGSSLKINQYIKVLQQIILIVKHTNIQFKTTLQLYLKQVFEI